MKPFFGVAATAMALIAASSVNAATVTCTGVNRSFTIDTSPVSTCFATDVPGNTLGNNLSGNSGGANPDPIFGLFGPGLVLIDKTDSAAGPNGAALTVTGSLSGGWSIASLVAPAGSMFSQFILGFKSGGNFNSQTVWAAFSLPDGVTSGTWSMTGKNGLSHANLYGVLVEKPSEVPLPAAGLGLIAALGGLAALRRRRTLA